MNRTYIGINRERLLLKVEREFWSHGRVQSSEVEGDNIRSYNMGLSQLITKKRFNQWMLCMTEKKTFFSFKRETNNVVFLQKRKSDQTMSQLIIIGLQWLVKEVNAGKALGF